MTAWEVVKLLAEKDANDTVNFIIDGDKEKVEEALRKNDRLISPAFIKRVTDDRYNNIIIELEM